MACDLNNVLELLKSKVLGNGVIFRTLKRSLNETTPLTPVLKGCARYLIDSTELSKSQLRELMKIIEACSSNIVRVDKTNESLDVENFFYHIMSNLVRLNCIEEALLTSRYTNQYVNNLIKLKIKSSSTDRVLKNCYLVFWNSASNENSGQELKLRLEALKYFSLCEENLEDLISRAFRAVFVFNSSCTAITDDQFQCCQKFNCQILNNIESLKGIYDTQLPNTLLQFHKWNLLFADVIQKYNSKQDAIPIFLQCNIIVNKIISSGTQLDTSHIPVCIKCFDLMTLGFELFKNFENGVVCCSFSKVCSHLELIITKELAINYKSMFHFALSVTRLLQSYDRYGRNPLNCTFNETKTYNEEQFLYLYSMLSFHLHLLSVEREVDENFRHNTLQANFSLTFLTLRNICVLIAHVLGKTQCDVLFTTVYSYAKVRISTINQLISEAGKMAPSESIENLGLSLSDLGKIMYNKKLYRDSIPFLDLSCSILMNWCWQDEIPENVKTRMLKVKMESRHLLLISSLRRVKEFGKCMTTLSNIIPKYIEIPTEFINLWVQTKNEINCNSTEVLKSETKRYSLSSLNLSIKKLFRLLQLELKAYKMQKRNVMEEQYSIICEMLSIARNPYESGMAMIEMAQVQWCKQFEGEKGSLTYCREAKSLLSSYLNEITDGYEKINAINLLATAHYWQYLAQLQISQHAVCAEMSKMEMTPLEKTLLRSQGEEEEESDLSCDAIPAYINISVEREIFSLKSLNEAVDLWEKIISTKQNFAEADQTILDLQATAEIYTLARQSLLEVRVWRLARQLAITLGYNSSFILCTSRLIRAQCRMGNFSEMNVLFESCSSVLKSLKFNITEDAYAYLLYHLTLAEYFLFTRNVDKGLEIIAELWSNSFLRTKSKSRYARLISAEIRLLASQFVLLPRSCYTNEKVFQHLPWENQNAIELAIQGLQYYIGLARIVAKDDGEKDQSPSLAHHVVASLMDANVIIAQMFYDIGAPREARFYLKEQLINGQRLALGLRTSEFLLSLAKIDILCDNCNGCRVKLNGIQSIIQFNKTSSHKLKKENVRLSEHDRVFMCKLGIKCPEFLTHSLDCTCFKCSVPMLNQVTLKMLSIYADCLAFDEKIRDAVQVALIVLKLSEKGSTKFKDNLQVNEVRLQSSRFMRLQEKYLEALPLINTALKQLEDTMFTNVSAVFLLPRLLYEKSISSLYLLALQNGKIPLEFAKPLWKINKTTKTKTSELASIINSMEALKLLNSENKFTEVECFQLSKPNRILTNKKRLQVEDNLKTVPRNILGLPSDLLCQAPQKKTKSRTERWNRVIEPSESSDSEPDEPTVNSGRRLRTRNPVRTTELKISLSCSDTDEESNTENKPPIKKSTVPCGRQSKRIIQQPILQESRRVKKLVFEDEIQSKEVIRDKKSNLKNKNTGRITRSQAKQRAEDSILTDERCVRNTVGRKEKIGRINRTRSKRTPDDSLQITAAVENLRDDTEDSESSVCVVGGEIDENDDTNESSDGLELNISNCEIIRGGGETLKLIGESSLKTEEVEKLRRSDEHNLIDINFLSQKDVTLESIISWLKKCFNLISHHPICPLYSNLCLTLALLQGNENPLAAFYLSESSFVTLRYQCNLNLRKKINKLKQSNLTSVEVNEDNKTEDKLSLAIEALKYFQDILKFTAPTESKETIFEKRLSVIPKDWTVCQITVIPSHFYKKRKRFNPPLVITRYRTNEKPIVVTVSVNDQNDVPRSLLQEFSEIQEESRQTMKSVNKVLWWESRHNLDNRMKNLVGDLENVWIGHWKGFFLGRPICKDYQDQLANVTSEILAEFPLPSEVDVALLEMLIDSAPYLSPEQLKQGIKELYGHNEDSLVTTQIIDTMRSKWSFDASGSVDRHSVVLILGKEIECLPWESMPILRSRSTSRMPSLSLLAGHLTWQINQNKSIFLQGVNMKDTYFILNPSNDLPNTQNKFEDWFVNREKWLGVTGRPPSESEFSQGLSSHDLFVYCGHGNGNKYLSGDAIQLLFCPAVTILMGCSSGKLRNYGTQLEPNGTVLQYLLAGCPCVLADLWDVTDRDIDRFLEGVLNFWSESKGDLLTNVVSRARSVCRLPFLIGAAPVVYGLPVKNLLPVM